MARRAGRSRKQIAQPGVPRLCVHRTPRHIEARALVPRHRPGMMVGTRAAAAEAAEVAIPHAMETMQR